MLSLMSIRGRTIHWAFLLTLCRLSVASADEVSPKFSDEDIRFFETKIRPVLVKQCYSCHSVAAAKANKLKGGLRVDSRAALLLGGESGPAIIPGDGEKSLLLEAIRYDSLQMPPDGKLADSVLADFTRWIERGAADPRMEDKPVARQQIDIATGRRHWAYMPLSKTIPSALAGPSAKPPHPATRLSRGPIDAFVLAQLAEQALPSAPEAEKAILLRRVYFDLIGLPPAPEEIDEFLAEESPDAYERLVDRLLASPHFGERWGRHWLSVARFAESVTLRGFLFPEAWRYRDYVIDVFNGDRPFDQFVSEQIAGDLLPAESLAAEQRQRIATTFLTLGNTNLEEQDKRQLRMDVVDEQLDAIGKGFLAQTLGCARCHDHKFDPISTRDYYALAGILANAKTLEHANVSKWLELPLPLDPTVEAEFLRQETAIADVQKQIAAVQQQIGTKDAVAVKDLPGIVVDDRQAKFVGDWERSTSVKPYIGENYLHDKNAGKGDKTATFLPELAKAGRYEVRLAYTPGDNRCDAVPVTVMSADGEKTVVVNQRQRPPLDNLFVSLGQYRFELNGQGFVIVATEGTTGHVIVDAVQFLPLDESPPPAATPQKSAGDDPEEPQRLVDDLKALQQELKRLQTTGPKRPRFMSVTEEAKIEDLRVHIRGTVHNLGEPVPRGFLQVVEISGTPTPNERQSGRLELGQWLTHRDNPLTPRVFANRVWHWLFHAGLSRTPDNFGMTGAPPSHPELLDYLAARFLEQDWHIKPLVRDVVLSRTYRLSSAGPATEKDPENRWLSHQNRRRLDAEGLLDAILTVSGRRNDEIGGNTIRSGVADDYSYPQGSDRRAVYWPVLRNSLPEIFEVFDFADPSTPTGTRNASTVAPQALYFLNDDNVAEAARTAAERLLAEPLPDDAARIQQAYRRILGRSPTQRERELLLEFLSAQPSSVSAWTSVVQSLFATVDFRYVE